MHFNAWVALATTHHTSMIPFKVFGISGATLPVELPHFTPQSWRPHLLLLLPLC